MRETDFENNSVRSTSYGNYKQGAALWAVSPSSGEAYPSITSQKKSDLGIRPLYPIVFWSAEFKSICHQILATAS